MADYYIEFINEKVKEELERLEKALKEINKEEYYLWVERKEEEEKNEPPILYIDVGIERKRFKLNEKWKNIDNEKLERLLTKKTLETWKEHLKEIIKEIEKLGFKTKVKLKKLYSTDDKEFPEELEIILILKSSNIPLNHDMIIKKSYLIKHFDTFAIPKERIKEFVKNVFNIEINL